MFQICQQQKTKKKTIRISPGANTSQQNYVLDLPKTKNKKKKTNNKTKNKKKHQKKKKNSPKTKNIKKKNPRSPTQKNTTKNTSFTSVHYTQS